MNKRLSFLFEEEINNKTYLIEATSFLMESDTFLLWLANVCQVGGSFGLRARDLAERIILQEPSMMLLPADVIGSWATLA